MNFISKGTESRRLLLLAAIALGIEVALASGGMFRLMAESAEWAPPLQLLVLSLPRFALMLGLVLLFGPFRNRVWFGCFLGAYALLLALGFSRAEVFVEWKSAIAAGRATLPYIAGLAGAVLAVWLRRGGGTSSATVPDSPAPSEERRA